MEATNSKKYDYNQTAVYRSVVQKKINGFAHQRTETLMTVSCVTQFTEGQQQQERHHAQLVAADVDSPRNMTQSNPTAPHMSTHRRVTRVPVSPQYIPDVRSIRLHQRRQAEISIGQNRTVQTSTSGRIKVELANNTSSTLAAQGVPPRRPPVAENRTRNPFAQKTWNSIYGSGWRLNVYNLPPYTEDVLLWRLFSPFGSVQAVKICRYRRTNMCKGFGFVIMTNYDQAVNAIQLLNGYVLDNGCRLYATFRKHRV